MEAYCFNEDDTWLRTDSPFEVPCRTTLYADATRHAREGTKDTEAWRTPSKCATNLFYFEGVVQTTRSQFRACIQTERSENDDSACSVPFRDYYYYYY